MDAQKKMDEDFAVQAETAWLTFEAKMQQQEDAVRDKAQAGRDNRGPTDYDSLPLARRPGSVGWSAKDIYSHGRVGGYSSC